MIRVPIFIPQMICPNIDNPYGYVYLTVNLINGKKYVGQHKPTTERNYKGSGTILAKAFKKYGKENFDSYPIDWAKTKEELNKKEIWWIDFLDAVKSREFYNVSPGGENIVILRGKDNPNYGKHLSKNQIKILSEAMKAKWNSGKPCGMTGRHHTIESRKKMSKNHADFSGENHPMYGIHRYGKDNPNYGKHTLKGSKHFGCKPVIQLSTNLEVIREYAYLKEVREYGYGEESVRSCCKGRINAYMGYIWMYKSDFNKMKGGTRL